MEKVKVKLGISALFIVGLVFTLIGSVFTFMGTLMCVTFWEDTLSPGFLLIPCGVGLTFLTVGILLLSKHFGKKKRLQAMVEEGTYFYANVIDVQRNTSISVNGRHPSQLLAEMKDPMGNIHVFKSRNFTEPFLQDFMGRQVKVYAKQGNLDCYYMDIEPLFNEIRIHE